MDNNPPSPEFETKVKTAASAPPADPRFVNHLRAQLQEQAAQPQYGPEDPFAPPDGAQGNPAQNPCWLSRLLSGPRANHGAPRGNKLLSARLMAPALAAVVLLAVAAFFVFNTPTPVSAQQILDRATQAAAQATGGIQHYRLELYDNPQALPGGRPGTTTIEESYYGPGNKFRLITHDTAGNIVDITANDGSYEYSRQRDGSGSTGGALTVSRRPVDGPKAGEVRVGVAVQDPARALFDEFNDNPRVELAGKITWSDGSPAYVLMVRNYQTHRTADGKETRTLTGTVKMIFNAQNYHLLESQTTMRKNGQDIILDSARWLVNEVLPEDSRVAWDLSDIPGLRIVDEPPANTEAAQGSSTAQGAPQSETLTEHELASRARAYVLKTVPAGLTLKIIAATNQPKDQDYQYEVNYYRGEKQVFGMMAIGQEDDVFLAKNFYDGSYQAPSGMTLHYSISSSTDKTSAILVTPEGSAFLLFAEMPREQVQNLVEELTPAK